RARFEVSVGRHLMYKVCQVEWAPEAGVHASLDACKQQQLTDQLIETPGFEFDSIQVFRSFVGRAPADQAERDDEPGERGAKFVGNVSKEASLGCNQGLDSFSHAIKVAAEQSNLVAAAAQGLADTCFEAAIRNVACRSAQSDQGPGDMAREPEAEN